VLKLVAKHVGIRQSKIAFKIGEVTPHVRKTMSCRVYYHKKATFMERLIRKRYLKIAAKFW
ncbi:hypothetical protein GGF37_004467, partial [Kickxella alabastrina]